MSPPDLALFLVLIIQRLFYFTTIEYANRTPNSQYLENSKGQRTARKMPAHLCNMYTSKVIYKFLK